MVRSKSTKGEENMVRINSNSLRVGAERQRRCRSGELFSSAAVSMPPCSTNAFRSDAAKSATKQS
eukprot:112720-Chlamydomonas_euryale.AAC.2